MRLLSNAKHIGLTRYAILLFAVLTVLGVLWTYCHTYAQTFYVAS